MRRISCQLVIAIAAIATLLVATAGIAMSATQIIQTNATPSATATPAASSDSGSWPAIAGIGIVIVIMAACLFFIFRERNDK